jgi:hypothetical protein
MKAVIESSLRWNNISRKFYKGLYEAFKDDYYLQLYYKELHEAIRLRGRWCRHYKGKK